MNTNRVTVRYAKALFNLALEEKVAEQVNKDMVLIGRTINVPDFKNFLESPVIVPSKKQTVFNDLFKGKTNELTNRFFKLLSENKREIYLQAIARNYSDLYREFYGIKSVQITTAFNVNNSLEKEVSDIISTQFKTKVEMTKQVDKNIVGGFILTVEGMQFDASVTTKLKEIKSKLLSTQE